MKSTASEPGLRMTGIWTLKFLSAPFEQWKSNGSFFVSIFEKFVSKGSKFCSLLWRKNPKTHFKNMSSFIIGRGGWGGGGELRIKNGTSLWNHSHPLICCAIFSAALRPCQVLLGLLEYLAMVLAQGVIGIFNVKQTGSSESSKNAQGMGNGQCGGYPVNLSFTLK